MTYYVPPKEQLVLEITCADLAATHKFFTETLNFQTVRQSPRFIVVQYEESLLFLCDYVYGPVPPPGTIAGNIRIMVEDVDAVWKRLERIKVESVQGIADREYGLRDFTIAGPDRIGIRFGSRISGVEEHGI